MPKINVIIILLFLLSVVVLTPDQVYASVLVDSKGMSVSFEEQELRKVFKEISDATGVIFRVDKSIKGKLSAEYRNQPDRVVFSRLLREYNHVLVFSDDGNFRVEEVYIFKEGRSTMEAGDYEVIAARQVSAGENLTNIERSAVARSAQHFNSRELGKMYMSGKLSASPFSAGGRSQLSAAASQLQHDLAMLRHKQVAEQKAIQRSKGDIKAKLSAGEGDAKELMKKLHELEGQELRARQNSQQQIIEKNKQLQATNKALVFYGTPAQQKIEKLADNSRQASIKNNQQRFKLSATEAAKSSVKHRPASQNKRVGW